MRLIHLKLVGVPESQKTTCCGSYRVRRSIHSGLFIDVKEKEREIKSGKEEPQAFGAKI